MSGSPVEITDRMELEALLSKGAIKEVPKDTSEVKSEKPKGDVK